MSNRDLIVALVTEAANLAPKKEAPVMSLGELLKLQPELRVPDQTRYKL